MRRSNRDNIPPPLSPSAFDLPVGTELPLPPQVRGRTAYNDHSYPAYSYASSSSPFSSAATSPASSPTSPFRRIYRGLSSSRSDAEAATRSRSQSPFSLHSILRGRRSLIILRHRPSPVDLALSEERSRCDGNSIERQGLNLMEPRPVDPVDIPMELNASVSGSQNGHVGSGNNSKMDLPSSASSPTRLSATMPPSQSQSQLQPRFVMGGIDEMMEGRA